MEEMYVVNLFAKTRTFTNNKGKLEKYQEPCCEITNSDGVTIYNGQVTNSNAQFHGIDTKPTNPFSSKNDIQNLADLTYFLLQNVSSSHIFCLRSHVRGFDLDKWFGSLPRLRPSGYFRLFSSMASVLIIAASVFTAFVAVSGTDAFQIVQLDANLIWVHGAFLLGKFIQEALLILWIGIGIYFAGAVLVNYLKGSIRILSNGVGIIILVLLYFPMFQFSEILMGTGSAATLISFLLVGFAIIFLIVTIVYIYIQSRKKTKGKGYQKFER